MKPVTPGMAVEIGRTLGGFAPGDAASWDMGPTSD